ncbi:MAG: molybdopterin cofactor-binding domain-containing protein [Pseudomonadota bacterium]
MSRIGRIARRTFLIGTAAIAGGIAVGYVAYQIDPSNPLHSELGEGETALTPYVKIDQSGVTIITPRADLGQGSYSVLAALVAEELDIAWDAIKVEHGPPSSAYYNGKVPAEGFPIAATDDGIVANAGRQFGDVVGKFMGLQITGGSSTIPDAYEKMRVAGAAARDAILEVAAIRTGFDKERLKTKDGTVITPDGKTLTYTALAPAAAKVSPPSTIRLKPESEWRYLGTKMRRLDIVGKSTGTAQFGIDMQLPGMVFATVRTNPRLGGAVNGFDSAAAEASPGVIKIVPLTGGAGVIADNTWRAFKAADLIKFDWGSAPYPSTTKEMFEKVAASFTEDNQDSRFKNEGDVEKFLAEGGVTTAEYRVPHLAHAPLEPMNATVLLRDGQLDIWTGTQIPLFVVQAAAEVSGLSTSKIRLHVTMSGGSFGRRLEDDYIRQAIEVAKAYPGHPVKMTWSREEDMTHDFPRPLGIARMRGKVRDGKVEALDLDIAAPSVVESQMGRLNQSVPGPDVAIVAGAWDQPFSIPNYRVSGYRVPAMVPVSSWRSVGASGNGFFHDCALDELIHAAGADPLAERIRLCWHTPSRKVLEAVGEMSNWGSKLPEGRGRGVAFTLSFGVATAEVVEVTNSEDGIKIDKVFVAVEVGKVLDPVNFENQVQGGVIWGLGHAMSGELTYKDGLAEQTNFDAYEAMRLNQVPEIKVKALTNDDEIRGIGEPSVPPAAPALANAIFAATGKRIRELPLNKHISFV